MYFVRPAFAALLLAVCGLDIALTLALPHRIDYASYALLALACLILGLFALVLRTIARMTAEPSPLSAKMLRLSAIPAEGLALALLMSIGLRGFDHLSKGTSVPLADDWLARVDQAMGFDWLGYFEFVRENDFLQGPMAAAYDQLNGAILLILSGLALIGAHQRVRLFCEAFILCALCSVIVGMAYPAIGAAAHWVPDYADPARFAGYREMPGVYFVDMILRLRDLGSPYDVRAGQSIGLVSVPSLHTAIGILLIAVSWRTWVFWPALGYGIVMIAATPIWGGHYLFDLLSGTAMALAAVWLLEKGPAVLRARASCDGNHPYYPV